MSTTTSRRAVLAGAAALPALGVPSAGRAFSAAKPDPIFAVIEAHRAASLRYNEALKAHTLAEEKRDDKFGTAYPTGFAEATRMELDAIGGAAKNLSLDTHKKIATFADAVGRKWHEHMTPAEVSEVRGIMQRELNKQIAEYDAAIEAADEAVEDAFRVAFDLGSTLARTVPTTLAGLTALLTYVMQFREFGGYDLFGRIHNDGDETDLFHHSVLRAVSSLAGMPPPMEIAA